MSDVIEIFNEFKNKIEKEQFVTKQHDTIESLKAKNLQLEQEVTHLKKMLMDSVPLLPQEASVQKIILTPEEALIESQLKILEERSYGSELTLEEVKKLDLLIKNKNIIKDQNKVLQGESKKISKKNYSNAELIALASKGPDGS